MSVTAPLLALAIAALLVWQLARSGGAMDVPNARSLHSKPTPRTGGMGILAGLLLASLLLQGAGVLVWVAAGLALVSLADDRWTLPVSVRLVSHGVAAVVLVLLSGPWAPAWMVPILVLALVWMTNLYNFMDGADGLAGGMSVIGFCTYALAAASQGQMDLALLALTVAAAAAGFLAFNYSPARIFMGDVGSIPLGFLAGGLGMIGWQRDAWPLVFPLIVFAPFTVDATVTLAKRGMRGERVWRAHREHYYQRLILSGWSHRRLACSSYLLMVVCAGVALFVQSAQLLSGAVASASLLAVLVVLMLWIDRRWRLRALGSGA
jgi:UDP-N-acetylmuramyl pentapeptide phosphotransferase/UDP-N-acetylglucosamine-1-phosphate transferase